MNFTDVCVIFLHCTNINFRIMLQMPHTKAFRKRGETSVNERKCNV